MKRIKKFAIAALVLVGIQFIRPAKNIGPEPSPLAQAEPPPPELARLLDAACYDCHSNRTRYPWYTEVQPIGWWLANRVILGKGNVNFSTLGDAPLHRVIYKLDECIEEGTEREMPPISYRLTHPEARLTSEQVELLTDWFDEVKQRMIEKRKLSATTAGSAAEKTRPPP